MKMLLKFLILALLSSFVPETASAQSLEGPQQPLVLLEMDHVSVFSGADSIAGFYELTFPLRELNKSDAWSPFGDKKVTLGIDELLEKLRGDILAKYGDQFYIAEPISLSMQRALIRDSKGNGQLADYYFILKCAIVPKEGGEGMPIRTAAAILPNGTLAHRRAKQ